MTGLSRRTLFRAAGALGVSTTLPDAADARSHHHHHHAAGHAHPHGAAASDATPGSQGFRFFNAREAAFVTAAVDRLIPPDERFTGAVGAGVPTYIDGQLAGAYGHGARFYRSGPWETGLPSQGYQLALNPAQLYRTAIGAFEDQLAAPAMGATGRRGAGSHQRSGDTGGSAASRFAALPPDQQDARLAELEAGQHDLGGVPSAIFFETLLANTIEGFFSDPVYGGNRDMVGWKMIGFPGAYASFLGVYTNHGQRFEREPMSIAQSDQDRPREGMPGGAMPGMPMPGDGAGGAPAKMDPGKTVPGKTAPRMPARGGERG